MALTFLGADLNPFNRRNPAVINLVLICAGVWVFTALLGLFWPDAVSALMFMPHLHYFVYQPWSVFTYIFLHAGFFHLFTNMLWLFFIGSILEDMTGKKHVWRLFIGGGIAGALLFMLLNNVFGVGGEMARMVGASGGVTAVIVGTAVMFPTYRVMLFGILSVELVWIAVFRVILDLLGASGPINQGGYICHLGGAAFGLTYMLHTKGTWHIPMVDSISDFVRKMFSGKKTKPMRSAKVNIQKDRFSTSHKSAVSEEEIDRILDKINATGYDSLTSQEKEKLFRAGE
ncbi:MAG: rhomboid family intramembrane serine protease [Sphingomonadales bacterium]|jgi:membrane associated rhomboid family serine protease